MMVMVVVAVMPPCLAIHHPLVRLRHHTTETLYLTSLRCTPSPLHTFHPIFRCPPPIRGTTPTAVVLTYETHMLYTAGQRHPRSIITKPAGMFVSLLLPFASLSHCRYPHPHPHPHLITSHPCLFPLLTFTLAQPLIPMALVLFDDIIPTPVMSIPPVALLLQAIIIQVMGCFISVHHHHLWHYIRNHSHCRYVCSCMCGIVFTTAPQLFLRWGSLVLILIVS